MAEPRSVRDPVHGFVYLSGKETDILRCWILQRLRGIRQLAFAHLVYPGARQTRFEHSLGVCHIAGLLAKQLDLQDEDRRLVRLGALVHDIGHGPFSHISEDVLEVYASRDKVAERLVGEDTKIHELVTQDLITSDADLKRALGEDDCTRISKLLAEGFDEPLLRSLVSGPLDADKQDYLLRDSHYCGVKYGIFDLDQDKETNIPPLSRHGFQGENGKLPPAFRRRRRGNGKWE
jgi:HD superfamily phosphohydrolase